jgi:MFS family permease
MAVALALGGIRQAQGDTSDVLVRSHLPKRTEVPVRSVAYRQVVSEPRPSLWHHRDFMKLWGAQSISKLGTQLGALSLTALVFLHASPAQMGILAAATGAPVVVAALASGVWVDRVRRRPVLIASDSVRAVLLGAVALGAALGRIGIGHVYVAGAITGAFTMLFDLAARGRRPADRCAPQRVAGPDDRPESRIAHRRLRFRRAGVWAAGFTAVADARTAALVLSGRGVEPRVRRSLGS